MMFRPLYPKKIMGYTWQGLFIKRQNEVAADYAALISKQLQGRGLLNGNARI